MRPAPWPRPCLPRQRAGSAAVPAPCCDPPNSRRARFASGSPSCAGGPARAVTPDACGAACGTAAGVYASSTACGPNSACSAPSRSAAVAALSGVASADAGVARARSFVPCGTLACEAAWSDARSAGSAVCQRTASPKNASSTAARDAARGTYTDSTEPSGEAARALVWPTTWRAGRDGARRGRMMRGRGGA